MNRPFPFSLVSPLFDFVTFRHNFGVNQQQFERREGGRGGGWQIVSFATFQHSSSERRGESLGETGQPSVTYTVRVKERKHLFENKLSKLATCDSRGTSFWATNLGFKTS